MNAGARPPVAPPRTPHVAVVGGGPAGLIAAETLAAAGLRVTVFDAMPSVGRKFLLAGRGGLNLTHSEALDAFLSRYGARREVLAPMVQALVRRRCATGHTDWGSTPSSAPRAASFLAR